MKLYMTRAKEIWRLGRTGLVYYQAMSAAVPVAHVHLQHRMFLYHLYTCAICIQW